MSVTMSRVTYFIVRAHSETGVSHCQHRKNSGEALEKVSLYNKRDIFSSSKTTEDRDYRQSVLFNFTDLLLKKILLCEFLFIFDQISVCNIQGVWPQCDRTNNIMWLLAVLTNIGKKVFIVNNAGRVYTLKHTKWTGAICVRGFIFMSDNFSVEFNFFISFSCGCPDLQFSSPFSVFAHRDYV